MLNVLYNEGSAHDCTQKNRRRFSACRFGEAQEDRQFDWVHFSEGNDGRLNIATGDTFYATVTPEGGIRLTPHDPKFEQAMKVARRGMKIYRNALTELAK